MRRDGDKNVLLLEPGKAEHPIRDYSELTLLVTAATAAHAVAIIARDQRPGVMLTHTKPVALPPSIASVVDDIPVVDIAAEHQAVLERALKAGRSPRIHIEVSNHVSQGPVKAANIIGEIPVRTAEPNCCCSSTPGFMGPGQRRHR